MHIQCLWIISCYDHRRLCQIRQGFFDKCHCNQFTFDSSTHSNHATRQCVSECVGSLGWWLCRQHWCCHCDSQFAQHYSCSNCSDYQNATEHFDWSDCSGRYFPMAEDMQLKNLVVEISKIRFRVYIYSNNYVSDARLGDWEIDLQLPSHVVVVFSCEFRRNRVWNWSGLSLPED